MKKTIEIECPDGYKPIYNAETGNVEIVPENIMGRIRTYEDAVNYLGCVTRDTIYYNRSVNSLAKLQTVLDALNEGHKFNLLTGTIWYPWVRFFRMNSVPKDAEVIGHFRYQGEKFALVGGRAFYGSSSGLGCFGSYGGVSFADSAVGFLGCATREIAQHFGKYFAKEIFDAKYGDTVKYQWIR